MRNVLKFSRIFQKVRCGCGSVAVIFYKLLKFSSVATYFTKLETNIFPARYFGVVAVLR